MNNKPIRIFLVEDDEDDYIITRDLLLENRPNDYELKWINNYEDALEGVKKDDYDIYIIDYRLGEMSGLDLLQEAKKCDCKAPYILLTGQGDYEVDVEAMKKGAMDYLVKDGLEAGILERSIRYAISRNNAELALKDSEERYRDLVERSPDSISVYYDKKCVYMNSAGVQLLGALNSDEIIGLEMYEFFHKQDERQLSEMTQRETASPELIECRLIRRDNKEVHTEVMSIPINYNNNASTLIISRDISHRKKLEKRVEYLQFYDELTELPKRLLLIDRLNLTIAQARRKDEKIALFFINIIDFKNINNNYGHPIGDKLLQSVAKRLCSAITEEDTIARMEGDEFAMVFNDIKNAMEAEKEAEKIHANLKEPFDLEGNKFYLNVNLGIAIFPSDGDNSNDLLKCGNLALTRIKGNRDKVYEFYQKEVAQMIQRKQLLENDLHQAIENDELEVYYQPQVDLGSGRMIGMEALTRWQKKDGKVISPAEFIPLAEETGLIESIGSMVIKKVCNQRKIWNEAGFPHIRIAVNLSARQFEDRNLLDIIMNTINSAGLNAHILEVEITEGCIMQNVESSIYTLTALQKAGIRVSVDDFGTGFSSLSHLRRLPLNILKIDQSFVKDLPGSQDSASIATAIIAMAHSLNLKVIAEGVETKEQMAYLRLRQCDAIQGYLFSKAVPAEEITKMFESGHRLEVEEIMWEH